MNADKSPLAMASVTVLIDTWWNVNKFVYYKLCNTRFVLIDTWWNVNKELADNLLFTFSF